MTKAGKVILGIATAVGAFFGIRYLMKAAEESPPTYTCPYCGETFETYEDLVAHVKAEHPSQPLPEFGNIWGYIKDALGARIAGASVFMDGIFETTSDGNGMYSTSHVLWGTHTITVQADNYEDKTIEVTTEAESTQLEILMDQAVVEPTDWTEGIQIQKITVTPETLYLGTTIEIGVYIQYPDPLPLPADIHGTLIVNGTTLTGDWTITYRNPTLKLSYTPAGIGTYTVKALDKSAHFTVLQDTVGSYYCPWGGVRMPVCTKILVPDVEPYYDHPGGDLILSGRAIFYSGNNWLIEEQLPNAVPYEWYPSDALIEGYVTHLAKSSFGDGLLVMATDYTCKEFWSSRDELAVMIARGLGGVYFQLPSEWEEYTTKTCPDCNGSGQVICVDRMRHCRLGEMTRCPRCYGTGKIVCVDLSRGWRDWEKLIRYSSVCGGGICWPRIWCPYCGTRIEGPPHTRALSWDKESFVRTVLKHIDERHPSHPLTEPAWF